MLDKGKQVLFVLYLFIETKTVNSANVVHGISKENFSTKYFPNPIETIRKSKFN